MWEKLRKSQVGGFKFRRQHSVENYILDFYCPEKKLAIEIDGGQHFEMTKNYDSKRDKFLREQRIEVVRFWNNEIFNNLDGVLFKIREELELEN